MIKMIGNLFNTDERNFKGLGSTQCGNLGIFMPPIFYMKSVLAKKSLKNGNFTILDTHSNLWFLEIFRTT